MNKQVSSIAVAAAVLVAAGVAVASPVVSQAPVSAEPAPRPAAAQPVAGGFWTHAQFEQDADDNRRYGTLPRPNRPALSRVGVVQVLEVEWDDGQIEVEGLNAQGREVDVVMDRTGQRVIRHKVERWDD